MSALRYRSVRRHGFGLLWLAAILIATTSVANSIELQLVFECQPQLPWWACVASEPALSPDGGCVAFVSSDLPPPMYEYWPRVGVASIDGHPCMYPTCAYAGYTQTASPCWSPDGTRLAYEVLYSPAPNSGIWIETLADSCTASSSLVHLTSGEFVSPAWSLDGSAIACAGSGGIYLVPSAGGTPALVIAGGRSPSCGPEGQFAFERDGDLWVRGVDGSERRIMQTAEMEGDPSWSPQGIWIAYVSNRSGSQDIWVVAASGGTPVQVTSGPAQDRHPSWSAHGDRIAFESEVTWQRTSIWIATGLPDWRIGIEHRSWGDVKQLFR